MTWTHTLGMLPPRPAALRDICVPLALVLLAACGGGAGAGASMTDSTAVASATWEVDFFDDFTRFDSTNWQDQRIWVNDAWLAMCRTSSASSIPRRAGWQDASRRRTGASS